MGRKPVIIAVLLAAAALPSAFIGAAQAQSLALTVTNNSAYTVSGSIWTNVGSVSGPSQSLGDIRPNGGQQSLNFNAAVTFYNLSVGSKPKTGPVTCIITTSGGQVLGPTSMTYDFGTSYTGFVFTGFPLGSVLLSVLCVNKT
jgi:hypothetical protein